MSVPEQEQYLEEQGQYPDAEQYPYGYPEDQYPNDPYAGQGQEYPDPQVSQVRSEAVKRIQQAKLYETLLSNNLFAPGSAEPEIQERVEAEIKEFVEGRLEELLGMRAPGASAAVPAAAAQLPFDAEQVEALTMVANRMLKRTPALGSTPTPSIQPVQAEPTPVLNQPVVTPVQAQPVMRAPVPTNQPPRPVPRPRRAPPAPARAAQPAHAPQPGRPSRRRPSGNVSEKTGRELSQATGRRKPAPMPPQAMIDNMNAVQAHKNAKAPKMIPSDDNLPAIDGGTSSASVGAALAKILQGQGG